MSENFEELHGEKPANAQPRDEEVLEPVAGALKELTETVKLTLDCVQTIEQELERRVRLLESRVFGEIQK